MCECALTPACHDVSGVHLGRLALQHDVSGVHVGRLALQYRPVAFCNKGRRGLDREGLFKAIGVLQEMREAGLEPPRQDYLLLLDACLKEAQRGNGIAAEQVGALVLLPLASPVVMLPLLFYALVTCVQNTN